MSEVLDSDVVEAIRSSYAITPQTTRGETLNISQHTAWKWCTENGCYLIKRLNSNSDLKRIRKGEEISKLFSQCDMPTVTAIFVGEDCLTSIAGDYYLLYPWISGSVRPMETFDLVKSEIVAGLLARIHNQDLHDDALDPELPLSVDLISLAETLRKIDCINDLEKEDLRSWAKMFNSDLKDLPTATDSILLSHSDTHPGNILWVENSPYIVDWEVAGMTYYSFDVVSTGLAWSGLPGQLFQERLFRDFLKTYKQCYNGDRRLNTSEGYWHGFRWAFGWLMLNLKSISQNGTDSEAKKRIVFTRTAIAFLKAVHQQKDMITSV